MKAKHDSTNDVYLLELTPEEIEYLQAHIIKDEKFNDILTKIYVECNEIYVNYNIKTGTGN